MNIEGTDSVSPKPKVTERDFLAAVPGYKHTSGLVEALRTGDYIKMPWSELRNWHAFRPDGGSEDNSHLPTEGVVKVSVAEIKGDENGVAKHIVIDAGGFRREVYPSLFCNYGRAPQDRKVFVGDGPMEGWSPDEEGF